MDRQWTARLFWLFWLGCLGPASGVFGLSPEKSLDQYTHRVWDTTDGLPHDSIRALTQTADGYLWIGTQAGLVRFDGDRFEVFDRSGYPEMASDHIESLAVGPHSVIWIGTYRGLVRFADGRMRHYGTEQGLPGDQVMSLHASPDGTLWIGTYEGGLARMRHGRIEPYVSPGRPIDPIVTGLSPGVDGELWIASFGGLGRLDADGSITHMGRAEGLLSDRIWEPLPARDGGLWLATDRGLQRVRHGVVEAEWTRAEGLSHQRVLSVAEDRDGQLWIGTFGGGLNRLRRDGRIDRLESPLPGYDAVFWDLFEDRDGNLWGGTLLGGLHLLQDGTFTPFSRPGLTGTIDAWLDRGVDEPAVLVRGRGLVDVGSAEPLRLGADAPPGASVTAALRSDDGELWLGTRSAGVHRGSSGRWRVVDGTAGTGPVVDLLETVDGTVWAASPGALTAVRPAQVRAAQARAETVLDAGDGLRVGAVNLLYEDVLGRLWVGGDRGLARIVTGVDRWAVEPVEAVDGEPVSALWGTADGDLWIATAGRGLLRLGEGRLDRLDSSHGLLEDELYALLPDRLGHLWIGSSRGVFRVAVDELERATSGAPLRQVLYDRRDGLHGISRAGSGFRDSRGRLWFTTQDGVARVDPDALSADPPPDVLLSNLWIDGRSRPVSRGPTWVEPGNRTLSVRFAAPRPGGLQHIRFRHRVVGFDDGWTEIPPSPDGLRPVELTHLPAGDYVFEVQAGDPAGRFPSTAARLPFRVEPALWDRPAVRWAAGFAMVLLLFAGHGVRIGRLEYRRRRLQAQVDAVLADVRVLGGMLPICSSCKSIRDDDGYWNRLESFISAHSEARFVRSLCPDCRVSPKTTRGARP